MKKSAVKQLCLFFEQFEVDYEIVSMIDEQKNQLSYQSLQNEKYIDNHLKEQITLISQL